MKISAFFSATKKNRYLIMQWDRLGIKGLAKTNASNDEPKDDHALLVEWKDCDQLQSLY